MRTLTTLFFMTALSFGIGCSGGDGDDGGPTADASPGGADSMPTGPDAMTSGAAEGQACAASEADPTGGCPTNYGCLGPAGSSTCFELCPSAMNNPECPGYEGPGVSHCIIGITDQGGNPVGNACGVVCGDTTGTFAGCAGGACDGTCPGTWSCGDTQTAGVKLCQ